MKALTATACAFAGCGLATFGGALTLGSAVARAADVPPVRADGGPRIAMSGAAIPC